MPHSPVPPARTVSANGDERTAQVQQIQERLARLNQLSEQPPQDNGTAKN
jgi:hypothetical protein